MTTASPFHEGELWVQQQSGEQAIAHRTGGIVQALIPPGAWQFLAQQPMAILASEDREGALWASLLQGIPGFLLADDSGHRLDLDLSRALPDPQDPLWANVLDHPQVGLLAIDFASRRRLRINGSLQAVTPTHWQLSVREAYPNCPKYIQRRHFTMPNDASVAPETAINGDGPLPPEQAAVVRAADTFFIASAHPQRGADASHRGGYPGFVEILDPSTLRIPDYPGNSMFNTLGNLAVRPVAGLLFVDWQRGRALQLTGTTSLQWDAAAEALGTNRAWSFHIERWREAPLTRRLHAEFLDYSPFLGKPTTPA